MKTNLINQQIYDYACMMNIGKSESEIHNYYVKVCLVKLRFKQKTNN